MVTQSLCYCCFGGSNVQTEASLSSFKRWASASPPRLLLFGLLFKVVACDATFGEREARQEHVRRRSGQRRLSSITPAASGLAAASGLRLPPRARLQQLLLPPPFAVVVANAAADPQDDGATNRGGSGSGGQEQQLVEGRTIGAGLPRDGVVVVDRRRHPSSQWWR